MILACVAAMVLSQAEPVPVDDVPKVEWRVLTGEHTFSEPMYCADEAAFVAKAEELRALRAQRPSPALPVVLVGLVGIAVGIVAGALAFPNGF